LTELRPSHTTWPGSDEAGHSAHAWRFQVFDTHFEQVHAAWEGRRYHWVSVVSAALGL
jgi:hypothetical protein